MTRKQLLGYKCVSVRQCPTMQWSRRCDSVVGYDNYDAIGNRLNTTGDLDGATNTYTPNAVNQYASVNSATLTYDEDGNLTNDGAFIYEWDGENRLKSATAVNGAQQVAFQYDYQGRRVEKAVYAVSSGTMGTTPLSVERYVYNGWNVVEVLDGKASNAVVRKQTWGQDLGGGIGGLLAVVNTASSSPGWLYFYDGFGNVGQVVDRADNSIVARYEYDAYGNTTVSQGSASLDNSYRFSTKAVDNETGFIYYGYRYYSPKLGRWISRDPLAEKGGLNLYGYVRNSPLNRIDPFGLCEGKSWLDKAWDATKDFVTDHWEDAANAVKQWLNEKMGSPEAGLTGGVSDTGGQLVDIAVKLADSDAPQMLNNLNENHKVLKDLMNFTPSQDISGSQPIHDPNYVAPTHVPK